MKKINRIKIRWLIPLLVALAFCHPSRSFAFEDTNEFSWLHLIPPGYWLDSWSFEDSNWDSDFGFPPLSYTNMVQVPDWDGNALQVDSTNAAWLTYKITENASGYGEYTNLTLDTGSIEFWFAPNWQSADSNFYGNGPNDWGRFIDVGTWTTNADSDWWSLYLNPSGTGIYFSSGTNGIRTNYLSAPISWDSSTWHMVVLTYGPTNTFLYLDGQLAATGDGVRYLPSSNALTNGFAIGSDFATGLKQVHGQIDDLYTYNYQLNSNDVASDYADISPELPGSFHPMDDSPPFPGEGGGGGGGSPDDDFSYSPNYGTNLWIAQEIVSNGYFTGILSNTIPGIDYQLLSMNSLNCSQWTFQGDPILATTNWVPWSTSFNPTTNCFLSAVSLQDDDGGLPIWWEQNFFGTNGVDPDALDPAGDGWTDYQKFAMGVSPFTWATPPPPPDASAFYNSQDQIVTLRWQPSPGSVTGYTITRIVPPITFYTFPTLSATATNFVDTSPVTNFPPEQGSPVYLLQANYALGNSENDTLGMFDPNTTVTAQILAGTSSNENLTITTPIPPGTSGLHLIRSYLDNYTDSYTVNTYDISTTNSGGNMFQLAANLFQISDANPINADWYVQTVNTNGEVSDPSKALSETENNSAQSAPTFMDGRQQLEQNLSFAYRSAPGFYAFANGTYYIDTYLFAGLFDESPTAEGEGTGPYLDKFRPFEENYFWHNFVYSPGDVDPSTGFLMTGADGLDLYPPLTYTFDPETTNLIIPAILSPSDTPLTTTFGQGDSIGGFNLGVTGIGGGDYDFSYQSSNFCGLPITSIMFAYNQGGTYQTSLLTLGETNSGIPNNFCVYWQTTPPELQTVGYYFAQPWCAVAGRCQFCGHEHASRCSGRWFRPTSDFRGIC